MASKTLGSITEHKVVSVIDDDYEDKVDLLQRAQWLRAAILGANDGLLSTTSLMLGVGAAREGRWDMILAGIAGAVAGACSMAVGEFVSVSTQRDIEENGGTQINKTMENRLSTASLNISPTVINGGRIQDGQETYDVPAIASPAMTQGRRALVLTSPGRSPMMRVISEDSNAKAKELTKLNGDNEMLPNPIKAAAASASAFLCGSFVPLVPAIFVAESKIRIVVIVMVTSVALALSGGLGAHLGGSRLRVSAVRVLLGGWFAMAITYGLLKPFEGNKHVKDTD